MKIAIIDNIKNLKFNNKSNEIVESLKKDKNIFIEKLNSISDLKNTFDIYIVITDKISEIVQCKKIIKNQNRILIITENSNVKFVMCSIELTKNLLYINTNVNKIKEKIYDVCSENN